MTPNQYRRWQDFALRMAHRGFGLRMRKSRIFVAHCIRDFFDILDSDYFAWDDPPNDNLLARITAWDQTEDHPTWRDGYGHGSNGPYVTDLVEEMMEHWNPHYWCEASDPRYKRWDELWGDRIRCCVRAGIDMASDLSGGVVGFTVGEVRRMYRGCVPDWVTGGNEKWLIGPFGGPYETNGTFAEMSDAEAVLL